MHRLIMKHENPSCCETTTGLEIPSGKKLCMGGYEHVSDDRYMLVDDAVANWQQLWETMQAESGIHKKHLKSLEEILQCSTRKENKK